MRVPCTKLRINRVHGTRYTESVEPMDIICLVVFPGGKGEKVVRGEHLGQTAVVCD
jgi:hypothetical protein